MNYKLLDSINDPSDIRDFDIAQLETLADDLRTCIIQGVSKTGGHLASCLGVVELTIAIHYVFDTPNDKLIWDVGHQVYAHKLLTGRLNQFHTLRKHGGISGFPKRSESIYDTFETGHSSTSISAGLGISKAKSLKKEKSKVIAVIGDGSLTAGMAYEALNQGGGNDSNIIVILNDNEMSIAPNVGALSLLLSRKISGKFFADLKKDLKRFLNSLPVSGAGDNVLQFLKKSQETLMTFFTPGMLFEAFKFKYVGPINGHNMEQLVKTLHEVYDMNGPILMHVVTKKGKGYEPAESNPSAFHGVGCFDVATGEIASQKKSETEKKAVPSYTSIFGNTMTELAEKYDKLVAITAAMPDGTGLSNFTKKFPERCLDVGIAEQHAVAFAAGLATEGFKPVVALYSTFLQRAYDQVIHDVCLPNLPVIFAIDRAGIVGEDGPTHHGNFDISYLRCLPNITVMTPKDENELRHMLFTAINIPGPSAIRYPRGKGKGISLDPDFTVLPIGKAEVLREGSVLLIIAAGSTVYPSVEAADILANKGVSVGVINARFIKPIDPNLAYMAAEADHILVVEENTSIGGFGSAVLELLNDKKVNSTKLCRIGLPDKFIEHGDIDLLHHLYGIDTDSILKAAIDLLEL